MSEMGEMGVLGATIEGIYQPFEIILK